MRFKCILKSDLKNAIKCILKMHFNRDVILSLFSKQMTGWFTLFDFFLKNTVNDL